jgi:integrase
MKDYQKTFPSLQELELAKGKIKGIRNRQGEYKRQIHYGCYLLCSQSGLRVNEAVKFDLKAKTKKSLYRIEKPKGKSERLVYVPKKVVKELKASN